MVKRQGSAPRAQNTCKIHNVLHGFEVILAEIMGFTMFHGIYEIYINLVEIQQS